MNKNTFRAAALAAFVGITSCGVVSTAGSASAAVSITGMAHTFSCALAWDPTIERAGGQLDSAGVPSNLVVRGGTGMDYRVIYYLDGPGTPSTAKGYAKTPKTWDFMMTKGTVMHPAPFTLPVLWVNALQLATNAGQVKTWRANILAWPTSVPAGPNAICTTLT